MKDSINDCIKILGKESYTQRIKVEEIDIDETILKNEQ